MRSIGVSHNSKDLHADLIVQSLELLEPDAIDCWNQTKSRRFHREPGCAEHDSQFIELAADAPFKGDGKAFLLRPLLSP